MPESHDFETKEIVLDTERDRIVDEYREIAEQMTGLDPSTDLYQTLKSRGERLDTQRRAVEWAMESDPNEGSGWGAETITFKALTLGDKARIADALGGRGSKPGSRPNWQIALGTYDAPYLEHDPESIEDPELQQTVANVGNIDALAFGDWAEAKIGELSAVGNRNSEQSFARLLTEMQATQAGE